MKTWLTRTLLSFLFLAAVGTADYVLEIETGSNVLARLVSDPAGTVTRALRDLGAENGAVSGRPPKNKVTPDRFPVGAERMSTDNGFTCKDPHKPCGPATDNGNASGSIVRKHAAVRPRVESDHSGCFDCGGG